MTINSIVEVVLSLVSVWWYLYNYFIKLVSPVSQTIIITIDGNIGSGKTTLEKVLKERFNLPVIYVREPVDDWELFKDNEGTTILKLFYSNPSKYGFPFQIMAFITRLKLLKDAIKQNPNSIIITERSLYTDKLVFAKMLFDTGNIEYVNYQIYLSWFNAFIDECPIHKIIYIKSSPETCDTRIKLRSRDGESSISLQYLMDCDKYHEIMMDELSHIPKLVLDGNIDTKLNPEKMDEWVSEIMEFILQ